MSDKYFIVGKWYKAYRCSKCLQNLYDDYLLSSYNPCPNCGCYCELRMLYGGNVETIIVRKKYKSFLHWIIRRYELEEKEV